MRDFYRAVASICLGTIPAMSLAKDSVQLEHYTFHLLVSRGAGGKTIATPSITVHEGQLACIEEKDGGATYRFEFEVVEQNGKPVASTKMIFTNDGRLTAAPRVSQFIGQKATIGVGGVEVGIDVQRAKAGA